MFSIKNFTKKMFLTNGRWKIKLVCEILSCTNNIVKLRIEICEQFHNNS